MKSVPEVAFRLSNFPLHRVHLSVKGPGSESGLNLQHWGNILLRPSMQECKPNPAGKHFQCATCPRPKTWFKTRSSGVEKCRSKVLSLWSRHFGQLNTKCATHPSQHNSMQLYATYCTSVTIFTCWSVPTSVGVFVENVAVLLDLLNPSVCQGILLCARAISIY